MVALHEQQLSLCAWWRIRNSRLKRLDKGWSSKCFLALITAVQRRASRWPITQFLKLLLIDLQAIYLFNMLAIGCNLSAFRPTWSWLQRRPNETELKIWVHARHTRPSNVTGRKPTETDSERDRDLCKWMYVWIWSAEITQNTSGTECMAIALTFPRVCSFDDTQKKQNDHDQKFLRHSWCSTFSRFLLL